METLKAVKIGFTNAAVLASFLVAALIGAIAFLSSYIIPMPEPLKVLSAAIMLISLSVLGLLTIGIIASRNERRFFYVQP